MTVIFLFEKVLIVYIEKKKEKTYGRFCRSSFDVQPKCYLLTCLLETQVITGQLCIFKKKLTEDLRGGDLG